LLQSQVADAVSIALYYLYNHPRKAELGYKIVLQLHDAIIIETTARSIDTVYNEIMPECMVDSVAFKSADLDGVPYTDSPLYHFGLDIECYARYGMHISTKECDTLGISHTYAE
jgi:hypothetical protein